MAAMTEVKEQLIPVLQKCSLTDGMSEAEIRELLETVTDTVIPLGGGAFETGEMTAAEAERVLPEAVKIPILR